MLEHGYQLDIVGIRNAIEAVVKELSLEEGAYIGDAVEYTPPPNDPVNPAT